MAELQDLIDEWLAENSDRDQQKFYESADFRAWYAANEMRHQADRFCRHVFAQLEAMVGDTGFYRHEILSLGCGPGSELVGVCRGIQRAIDSGCRNCRVAQRHLSQRGLRCVGVDLCDWNSGDRCRQLVGEVRFDVSWRFVSRGMEAFVRDAVEIGQKFGLVLLSHAGVKDKVDFVAEQVPKVLNADGAVFVVDRDVESVRSLATRGFRLIFGNGSFVFLATDKRKGKSSGRRCDQEAPSRTSTRPKRRKRFKELQD